MAIPDYQSIMLPFLEFAQDKKEHSLQEAFTFLAERFSVSELDDQELIQQRQGFLVLPERRTCGIND